MNHERSFSAPAAPEQEKKQDRYSLDAVAQRILESEAIKRLPEHEQGSVIVDSFIGALARKGTTESAGRAQPVQEVLAQMDEIRTEDDYRYFGRKDGLRAAVRALTEDERTASHFGHLEQRVAVDERGQLTLTTPEQVIGYLSEGDNHLHYTEVVGGVHTEGSSWVPIIAERAVGGDAQWIDNPHRGMIESDNDYLRSEGNKWRMAAATAQKKGVDMMLLGRSSRYIRRKRDQQDALQYRG